ncbi:MAG: MFS transporter [Candidatus Paceibacterota bacterium]|jgi:MFS family permease
MLQNNQNVSKQESKPKSEILGLDRNVFMLGLTSFFNDFSNEMILSAFPAFFTSVLKTGAASLGLVEGLADGASNILKIYSGSLSDKLQRHRIFIFIGYSLSVVVRPFYVFTGSIATVLGLRVIDRVGKGLREPPRDVIISASVPSGNMGRSFGYHRAMDRAGGILGPLAAYLILLKWPGGFNIIFMSAFLLGIIAVATILFVVDIASVKPGESTRLLSLKSLRSLPSAFRVYLLAIFLLSVGSLPLAVLLLKTTSIGLLIASIPLFYMVYSIAYSAFSYFAGKLSDNIGTTKVLVFGYLILLASYILIGFASASVALAIAFIVLGMSSAATDASQRAVTGRIVELSKRGTAYGLFNAAVGFGAMFAGIAGGYIWQMYSPTTALFVAVIMIVIGLFTFAVSLRMKK